MVSPAVFVAEKPLSTAVLAGGRDGCLYRAIRERWLLALLVAAAQAVCVLLGLAAYQAALHGRAERAFTAKAHASNAFVASDLHALLHTLHLDTLDDDAAVWMRIQALIESLALPDAGVACIVDRTTGRVRCHPELRKNAALASANLRDVRFAPLRGDPVALQRATSDSRGVVAGRATLFGTPSLMVVRDLPALGAQLVVAQPESIARVLADDLSGMSLAAGLAAAMLLTVLSACSTALIAQRYERRLTCANADLEALVERRGLSAARARDAMIFGLAKLAESRDDDTGEHLRRIQHYVVLLAEQLAATETLLTSEYIARLAVASTLHDIGKVGVPDAVLCKPGPLTPHERAIVEKHPVIGGECLLAVREHFGDEDELLDLACEIAYSHHERWDGRGYPFGLRGDETPVPARIVAVADVYDALTTRRSYKPALSHDVARRIILDGAGTQFDPRVVQAFLAVERRFAHVSQGGHAAGGELSPAAESAVTRRRAVAIS